MAKQDTQVRIDFFNIKSGEKIWVRRKAQIKAVIESSDLGINRQSDMKWRLGEVWVNKLDEARSDRNLMQKLAQQFGGAANITDADILFELLQREIDVEVASKTRQGNDTPYEKHYRENIAKVARGEEASEVTPKITIKSAPAAPKPVEPSTPKVEAKTKEAEEAKKSK